MFDREYYEALSIPVIPVLKDRKQPNIFDWPTKPTEVIWAEFGEQPHNLARRLGGGHAMLDADNRFTAEAARSLFAGLGFMPHDLPVVRSPSGGGRRHFHFELRDHDRLSGSYKRLSGELAGEFRYGFGSVALVPASEVGGVPYELVEGDWRQTPVIETADLLPLFGERLYETPKRRRKTTGESVSPSGGLYGQVLSVPVLRRAVRPAAVVDLLKQLAEASKGESVGGYSTRSEAEFAVVMRLILAGWSLAEVSSLFRKYSPGHYAEYKRESQSEQYLEGTFYNAAAVIEATAPRPVLARQYRAAERWSAQYDTDRRVYLALLSIAYQVAEWQPAASHRDLQLLSGVGSRHTIGKSLERLRSLKFISPVAGRSLVKANRWKIFRKRGRAFSEHDRLEGETYEEKIALQAKQKRRRSGKRGQLCTIRHIVPNSVPQSTLLGACLSPSETGALWSQLGASCPQVYSAVAGGAGQPVSETAIAEQIGKSVKTVKRALRRLAEAGLVAERSAGERSWRAVKVKRADLIDRFDLSETVKQRRSRVATERRQWRQTVKHIEQRKKQQKRSA